MFCFDVIIKNITSGEGVVVSNDLDVIERVKDARLLVLSIF